MTKRNDALQSIALYAGLIPVLAVRQLGLRFFSADPEASQVALFISFFIVGAGHAWILFRFTGIRLAGIVTASWWLAEYIGLRTGLIFGRYEYRDILGPAILDVPIIIPLVWFAMFWGARWTACICCSSTGSGHLFLDRSPAGIRTTLMTAGLMTLWDMAMDFDQVTENQWVWLDDGAWFGIPLWNFAGWFTVSILIQLVILLTFSSMKPVDQPQVIPPALFFLLIVWLADLKAVEYGEPILALLVAAPLALVSWRVGTRVLNGG